MKGFKTKTLAKCTNSVNKRCRINREDNWSSSPNPSDELHGKRARRIAFEEEDDEEALSEEEQSEEEDDNDEEEEDGYRGVHRESSVYDNLLLKLKASDSKAQANGSRKSKNKDEDGSDTSDTEEEGDIECDSDEQNLSQGGDSRSSDEDTTDEDNGPGENNSEDQASLDNSQSKFGAHIAHKLSKEDSELLLKRKWKYRWIETTPDLPSCKWTGTGDNFLKDLNLTATAPYGLQEKLFKHWLKIYDNSGGKSFHSSRQRLYFTLCSSYRDILHHQKRPFYQKGSDEDSNIMDAYIMHLLNHVYKTRDLILKNNARLPKDEEEGSKMVIADESFIDQSFTRPKVLILLPLASIAYRFVKRLIRLTPPANKVTVEYMDRFIKQFGDEAEGVDELEPKNSSKPVDHQALFGGNSNEDFMLGIKFTKKSIKLYSDFYSSDVIVASPLGLHHKCEEAKANKGKNVDYLSSIEILVVDHADVIAMQKWSNVQTVVTHLNRLPSTNLQKDIMRIRRWYHDGHAQFYRQTIILSSYLNPDINALFNQHCLNFEGKLRLSSEHKGVLSKVILPIRQVYQRFDSDSITEVDDARLDYFVEKVFPKIKDSVQGGIMIFLSSYLELVRVRNFMMSQNASFCQIHEEIDQRDTSRARNWFNQEERKIMLYTERRHFYSRYKIRGIKNLFIYNLPEKKEFYPEVLNMLEGSHDMTCTVLFSRFDLLRLERIVGSAAAKRLTTSEKGLFIFN